MVSVILSHNALPCGCPEILTRAMAGETLGSFSRSQRLSVAAMLRQSPKFWVVDMHGVTASASDYKSDGDDNGVLPMQVLLSVFNVALFVCLRWSTKFRKKKKRLAV
jgi:hypothetical protein